ALRLEFSQATDVDFIPLDAADIGEAALERQTAEEGHVAALPEDLTARSGARALALRPTPGGFTLPGGDAVADALAPSMRAGSGFEIVELHRLLLDTQQMPHTGQHAASRR